MPARQRRSSVSRTSSREANVKITLTTRKNAQTSCETSYAPRSFELVGDVVGLEVQRGDDAEHHGEDAADEDGEEVVDARAAAPQPVQALDVEGERHQDADERQHVDVLLRTAGGPW